MLLRLLFALAVAVVAVEPVKAAQAPAVEQLDASAFGRLPNVQSVRLSPDGTRLAMIVGNTQDERSIVVTSLETGEATRIPTGDERPLQVQWWSNDRIGVLFQKLRRQAGGRANFEAIRLLLMDPNGENQREINPPVQPSNLLLDDPDHVIVVAGVTEGRETRSGMDLIQRTDVYRLNIRTGRSRTLNTGRNGTTSWILDYEGEPIVRIDQIIDQRMVSAEFTRNLDVSVRRVEYYSRIAESGEWGQIFAGVTITDDNEADEVEDNGQRVQRFSPAGLTADGQNLYLIGRLDGDKVALHTMDLRTGEITERVIAPERNDFGGILRDRYTRLPVAYANTYLEPELEFADAQAASIYFTIQNAFPDSLVSLESWDQSRTKAVVHIQGGTVVSNYYLYDMQAGSLSLIARAYPEIPDSAANPVQMVEYTARDGLVIPAYVTYPRGRDPENLPMIMLPHGGPEARDFPGFDFWSQFLAHRGYVVMQPQFRHSSGFGREFATRGYGQWGLSMQDDLTDGVNHLVDQGVVDPDRVCIFGWSYGGYAAAAGATLTPEVYRCAIAGAAVTDLARMINWVRDRTGANSSSVEYWERAIGDRFADRQRLSDMSPALNVDRVVAPILIQHGSLDTVVPPEQGELFYNLLRQAGKDAEYVELAGENHNILFGETRIQQLETMDTFLQRVNPAY